MRSRRRRPRAHAVHAPEVAPVGDEMRRSRSGRARVSREARAGARAPRNGQPERTSCNATTVLDIHKDYSGGMRENPVPVLSIILERRADREPMGDPCVEPARRRPRPGASRAPSSRTARSCSGCIRASRWSCIAIEAEGYYLNASSESPSVFVCLRSDEADGRAHALPGDPFLQRGGALDGFERARRTHAGVARARGVDGGVGERELPPEPRSARDPVLRGQGRALRERGSHE
jgi:hypothetical protein